MYVYFDENGTLKEIVSDKSFRIGDSKRDKIYVYWEGEHAPVSGWVKYRKPNGKEYPDLIEECFYQLGDQLVEKTLPNKPLRNLKYFSYDHTYEENGKTHIGYQFYEITIPDAILNSSIDNEEIPTENNMVIARIRFVMDDGSVSGEMDKADSIEALGTLVFSVETNIGILTDSSINETQYNYLIQLVSMKLGANTKSIKVSQLPSTGVAGTIYYVERENNGIVYDAYFWNGTEFVFMGTTSYGLYTKQEGDYFETAIQTLWNTEMTDYKAFMNSSWANYQNTINAQIANLSKYIQSAASGSPKGVYSTLSALQAAYPSGTNGIYVVSENGHWYYWNDTAWTDGGVYQAVEIADGVITTEKTDFVKGIKNIINPSDFVEKKYWYNGNGKPSLSGENDDLRKCIKIDIHNYKFITLDGKQQNVFSFLTDASENIISNVQDFKIDNSNNNYYYLYLSYYKQNNIVVVNANVDDITITNYPYWKYSSIKIEGLKTDFDDVINLIRNIYDKQTMYNANKYWWNDGTTISLSDGENYKAIKLFVTPNTWYTTSKRFNNSFSFCADKNNVALGKVIDLCEIENNSIKTPNNVAYLYLTYTPNDDINSFVVLNTKTNSINDYLETKYNEVLGGEIKEISKGTSMKYLYVSVNGSDETGDGSKDNPYASIYKANSVITDNSELNRYTIIVGNGTYTDLQTKYAGDTTTGTYKGIVCKKYVYYQSETPNNPNATIIEWDGATGFASGTLTDSISADMCAFHITSIEETSIKGFKFVCKNTRYCLHIEQNTKSKWLISNCIFEWGGVPDVTDVYKNRPCVGMGISLQMEGKFYRCKFSNVQNGYFGLQSHDNVFSGEHSDDNFENGAKIIVEECDFNNTSIQMRSGQDFNRILPFVITLNGCGRIARLYDEGGNSNPYWRVELKGSIIQQLDMQQY